MPTKLTDQSDVKRLCEVNHKLYDISTPILYEKISIWARNEDELTDVDVEPFLRARPATNDLLRHAKCIEVISRIDTVRIERCFHRDSWDEYRASHSGESEELAAELAASLLPVIEACRDESLRSFS